jgi:hypothetical protein
LGEILLSHHVNELKTKLFWDVYEGSMKE